MNPVSRALTALSIYLTAFSTVAFFYAMFGEPVTLSCNPFFFEDVVCSAAYFSGMAYMVGFVFIFAGALVYLWTNKTQAIVWKICWGGIIFTIFPFGVLLYYWTIWRPRYAAVESPEAAGKA